MADDWAAEEEADRVRQCLATQGSRFEYQGTLGKGSFGVACLIRHNHQDGTTRDFVVKRALREKDQRNLQDEVGIAKIRLRIFSSRPTAWLGACMINCLAGVPRAIRLLTQNWREQEIGGGLHFSRPIHMKANPLTPLGGPVMTMEYLAMGPWGDFANRSRSLGFPLPNWLLWRLFACCKSSRGARGRRRTCFFFFFFPPLRHGVGILGPHANKPEIGVHRQGSHMEQREILSGVQMLTLDIIATLSWHLMDDRNRRVRIQA